MINKIKNILLWRTEGFESLKTPQNTLARFTLSYKNLIIGYLNLNDGKWIFEYSTEFRNQERLMPMIDFPDVSKRYESEQLWPFFTSRIPSQSQPEVQNIIRRYNIEIGNEVSLLKLFGKRTITNPYLLEFA